MLAVAAVIAVAVLTTVLTAPRPGGLMEAGSTSPDGAHALVTLLGEHGVDVVVADDLEAVVRAARPDTLIVVAQTFFLYDDDTLATLAGLPGDRLVVAPTSATRERLAPGVRRDGATPELAEFAARVSQSHIGVRRRGRAPSAGATAVRWCATPRRAAPSPWSAPAIS